MQFSPYTPGQVARIVPGREDELADYERYLSLLADAQRLVARPHIEAAPRGYGKTSLLRQVQSRAEARGIVTVWITAGQGGIIKQLAEGIRGRRWSRDTARSIGRLLDSITIGVGVPGVARVDAKLTAGRPDAEPTARDVQNLISSATHHAIADHKLGLIILIDEIQEADEAGFRALAYAWQHLQSEEPSLPAAFFGAGLPSTSRALTQIVTFSERYLYRNLPILDDDAERIALVQPARSLDVTWEEQAVDLARAEAAGYPPFVQTIGDAAWAAAGYPDPGAVITAAHAQRAIEKTSVGAEGMFRDRWTTATRAQQRFIAAMARVGDGVIQRADIEAQLGTTGGNVSKVRDQLIKNGIISGAGRGRLEFTLPGFAEFVRGIDD